MPGLPGIDSGMSMHCRQGMQSHCAGWLYHYNWMYRVPQRLPALSMF